MAISTLSRPTPPTDAVPSAPGQCAANGCPGAGAIESGSQMLCCWHNDAPSHLWPAVTSRVRKYRQVEHIIRSALTVGFYDWQAMAVEASEFFKERGWPDLAPKTSITTRQGQVIDETMSGGAYAYRLQSWLRAQILTEDMLAPKARPGVVSAAGPRRLFGAIPQGLR